MSMCVGQSMGTQTINQGNQLTDKTAAKTVGQTTNKAAQVPENKKNEWTCVSWFNKVTKAVADKTCHFFGRLVAVVTAPFTFIPSLFCDIYKSLCDRKVSKPEAPIQNQVSTKGQQTVEAKKQPTVEQLRKDYSDLDNIMKATEVSADEINQKARGLEAEKQQLQSVLTYNQQELAKMHGLYREERIHSKMCCDQWSLQSAQSTNALKDDIAALQNKSAQDLHQMELDNAQYQMELENAEDMLQERKVKFSEKEEEFANTIAEAVDSVRYWRERAAAFAIRADYTTSVGQDDDKAVDLGQPDLVSPPSPSVDGSDNGNGASVGEPSEVDMDNDRV